jgi:hypothetical protein
MTNLEDLTLAQCFLHLEQNIHDHPNNLEPIITELHSILNKWDPRVKQKAHPWPLVHDAFPADEVLKRIRDTADLQTLKIPQIRFKADQLSKTKRIPLPNSTRKHKDPLLQWFSIHWAALVDDIKTWNRSEIPSVE